VTLSRLLRVAAKLCLIREGLTPDTPGALALFSPSYCVRSLAIKAANFLLLLLLFFTLSVQPRLYRLLQYTALISEPFCL
jgi:hypothetical protein